MIGKTISCYKWTTAILATMLLACQSNDGDLVSKANWLPTGVYLDPAGPTFEVGPMPLNMVVSPEGDQVILLLSGWREQGLQVIKPQTREIIQTIPQKSAFLGLALAPDGKTLYASGGNQDVVYRYQWTDGKASLLDSLALAEKDPKSKGTRYPAGLALSKDSSRLYVAENLADSLAVVDVSSYDIVQRLPAGRYPYDVVVTPKGTVYVSAWAGDHLSVFRQGTNDELIPAGEIGVGYHPSDLLLSQNGERLFVTSASTDRIIVIDTNINEVIAELHDPAPEGPHEGSTPNFLALSHLGDRLFVAEADNNAIAVFDLSAMTSGITEATGTDSLIARIPTAWYPCSMALNHDELVVASGKGMGTGPNADIGPQPDHRQREPRGYTLGQISGSVTILPGMSAGTSGFAGYTDRVHRANGWNRQMKKSPYPPFRHVIYIIKENRTYDQIFGDLSEGDGDSSLVYFPRSNSPNHHALAERFGLYDRFFVNAEVSPDGHNWSTAAYTTDYLQKTVPSNYSGRGRSYDYEGTNRGMVPETGADAAEPARGYLWDLVQSKELTFRNFGEFVIPDNVDPDDPMPRGYRGLKPFLENHTETRFPGYNLDIPDQVRADVWIASLQQFISDGEMPQLQIVRLPNDHTKGARAGALSPKAYMADNDLALGRVIEALSESPFWQNTIVLVVEDDAQNGPDHVDSHRAPFLAISPYNKPGVISRFVNTTDVLATIEAILQLESLSQFDYYGRPLRHVFADEPDLDSYKALTPEISLDERNPETGPAAAASAGLDFRFEDIADEDLFNRVLWMTLKGPEKPYPGINRAEMIELMR